MTELLSYEVIMNLVDEYEGNDYNFEYYPIDDQIGCGGGKWLEMSYYRETTSWDDILPSEWEEFLEES